MIGRLPAAALCNLAAALTSHAQAIERGFVNEGNGRRSTVP
jgi:hypothetical protein